MDIFTLTVYTRLSIAKEIAEQIFRPALLLEYTSTFTMHSAHSPKTHAHAACMHIAQFLSFFVTQKPKLMSWLKFQ